jgi:hypothetical protein
VQSSSDSEQRWSFRKEWLVCRRIQPLRERHVLEFGIKSQARDCEKPSRFSFVPDRLTAKCAESVQGSSSSLFSSSQSSTQNCPGT